MIAASFWVGLSILLAVPCRAQSVQSGVSEKIIVDTDIGDDVDDAFAVALGLRSPELEILGITTTFGDTETRAKLLDRFLGEAGRQDIPVAVGEHLRTPTINSPSAAMLKVVTSRGAPTPRQLTLSWSRFVVIPARLR